MLIALEGSCERVQSQLEQSLSQAAGQAQQLVETCSAATGAGLAAGIMLLSMLLEHGHRHSRLALQAAQRLNGDSLDKLSSTAVQEHSSSWQM